MGSIRNRKKNNLPAKPGVDDAPSNSESVGAQPETAPVPPAPSDAQGPEVQQPQEPKFRYTFPASMSMVDRRPARLLGAPRAVLALPNTAYTSANCSKICKLSGPGLCENCKPRQFPDWTSAHPSFSKILSGELPLGNDGCDGPKWRDHWTQELEARLLVCYKNLQISWAQDSLITEADWKALAGLLEDHQDDVPRKSWSEAQAKFNQLKEKYDEEKMKAPNTKSVWPHYAKMAHIELLRTARARWNPPVTAAAPAQAQGGASVAGPSSGSSRPRGAPRGTAGSSRGAAPSLRGASGGFGPEPENGSGKLRRELASRRRRSRGPLYGAHSAILSPTVAEIFAGAEYDFVVVDLVDSDAVKDDKIDGEKALDALVKPIMEVLAAGGCPCILRLSAMASAEKVRWAVRLDPSGISFAHIKTVEQAREVAQSCRRYAEERPSSSRTDANKLFVSVELSSSMEKIVDAAVDIALIEDVDCVQLPPFTSPKEPSGGFQNDKERDDWYMRRLERYDFTSIVLRSIRDRKPPVYVAGLTHSHETSETLMWSRYDMVTGTSDFQLLMHAAFADVDRKKARRPSQP